MTTRSTIQTTTTRRRRQPRRHSSRRTHLRDALFRERRIPDSMRVVIEGMAICIGRTARVADASSLGRRRAAVAAAAPAGLQSRAGCRRWTATARRPTRTLIPRGGRCGWCGKWSVGTAHDAGLLSDDQRQTRRTQSGDERLRSMAQMARNAARATPPRRRGARRGGERRRIGSRAGGRASPSPFLATGAKSTAVGAGPLQSGDDQRLVEVYRVARGDQCKPMEVSVHAPRNVCAAATSPDGIEPHAHAVLHPHWPACARQQYFHRRPRL